MLSINHLLPKSADYPAISFINPVFFLLKSVSKRLQEAFGDAKTAVSLYLSQRQTLAGFPTRQHRPRFFAFAFFPLAGKRASSRTFKTDNAVLNLALFTARNRCLSRSACCCYRHLESVVHWLDLVLTQEMENCLMSDYF
jgi:hypothetical protein